MVCQGFQRQPGVVVKVGQPTRVLLISVHARSRRCHVDEKCSCQKKPGHFCQNHQQNPSKSLSTTNRQEVSQAATTVTDTEDQQLVFFPPENNMCFAAAVMSVLQQIKALMDIVQNADGNKTTLNALRNLFRSKDQSQVQ